VLFSASRLKAVGISTGTIVVQAWWGNMEVIYILVRPEDPKNVGAAARAMKTMGHTKLYLVNPCSYLCSSARALAHGSHDILEGAQIFPSLEAAASEVDFLIGTTARHRRLKVRYHDCRELPALVASKGQTIAKVGIVFGGETSGLCNDDLFLCDVISSIPTAASYPSLNLAQSVMIYSFLFNRLAAGTTTDWRVDEKSATPAEYKSLKTDALKLIDALDMPNPKPLKRHIIAGLSRLGHDDLYLVHDLRKRIAAKIFGKAAEKDQH
jgi:tRNA/rRNA methyltransferase